MHARRLILLCLIVILVPLAVPQQSVKACTPPPTIPHYTVADHVHHAAIVLEGRVVAVQKIDMSRQTATLWVDTYYKGSGPQQITVSGYGQGSLCLSDVSNDQTGIFFIAGDAQSGYRADYMFAFDAIYPNNAQTIQEIVATTGNPGHSPEPAVSTPDIGPLASILSIAILIFWLILQVFR
jgi:hypothetical protein